MLFRISQFIHYFFYAKRFKSSYSEFVNSFVMNVLKKKVDKKKIAFVKEVINDYKNNKQLVSIQDYGAGSITASNSQKRTINNLLSNVTISFKYGRLLNNIVEYYNCLNCIELGTSLGVSTLFLRTTFNQITTIEGNKEIAALSKKQFNKYKLNNIKVINAKFDDVFENTITNSAFDLLFIDGNHTEEATLRYFEMALKNKKNSSIIIFDDIYWSIGMKNAWNRIKEHQEVKISIDLFQFGIVFFNENKINKEDYKIWC